MLSDSQLAQILSAIQAPPPDMWLERLYWASQILLLLLATAGAIFAYTQLKITRTFELLRFVEREDFRAARRVVYHKIRPQPPGTEWWQDEKLEEAAALVCAFYDILGIMVDESGSVGQLFTDKWAASIVPAHRHLLRYIEFRRQSKPDAFVAFTALSKRAERHV